MVLKLSSTYYCKENMSTYMLIPMYTNYIYLMYQQRGTNLKKTGRKLEKIEAKQERFLFLFLMFELRDLHLLGRHSTIEPCPQPL
jgi:hypothetical protein